MERMTERTRKAATTPRSQRRGTLVLTTYLERLHRVLDLELHEPGNPEWPEEGDRLVDSMWVVALECALTPHLCPDRYCHCHVALYQGEPETLWGNRIGW